MLDVQKRGYFSRWTTNYFFRDVAAVLRAEGGFEAPSVADVNDEIFDMVKVGGWMPPRAVGSNPIQSNPIQSNPIQSNPIQSKRIESNRTEPNRTESNRIESNRTESNRIESNRIESNRIESNRIVRSEIFEMAKVRVSPCEM